MPDDLKPGDEIVFTVVGTSMPKKGEFVFEPGGRIAEAREDFQYVECLTLTRTVRRAGERPGYFDARFEKIEAAIAALGATVDGMLAQSRSPEAIVKNMAIVTETLAAAIRAERKP